MEELFDAQALGRRIRRLRETLGQTQTAFGKRFRVDQSTVARWENGHMPKEAHIARLAALAGQHPAEFVYGPPGEAPHRAAPVVGYVGAGQQVFPVDDHALGAGMDEVEAPAETGSRPVVAVRVRGDSMHPMKDGWLLFYSREQDGVAEDCVGRLCVVQVAEDGPLLVKELRRGYAPGTWTLLSWSAAPIEDARVAWAAPVLSIRPA